MRALDQTRWDAVVVGAGPAGSAAARLLAVDGARVLLVDAKAFPREKVCGGCWSASGLELLRALGAQRRIEALPAQSLWQFHMQSAAGPLILRIPQGLALSRADVDAALAEHAVDAGATFLPKVRATVGAASEHSRRVELRAEGAARPESIVVDAGVILAADGLGHPSLCRLPGFGQHAAGASRLGAGCQIEDVRGDYQKGTIYMAVGREGYVGLVVLEGGAVNVAAALAPAFVNLQGGLAQAATAFLRDAGFPPIPALAAAPWRGTPLLTRHEPVVAAERLLLLGDAAGYAEPFTGEGMTWAILSAFAVQPMAQAAWRHWRPELALEWTAAYRKLIGRRQRLCRTVTRLLRLPLAVRAITSGLNLVPGLQSSVVQLVSPTPAARLALETVRA